MEWRIFFPLSEGSSDVWTLLGQGQLSRHLLLSSEVRRDIYVSCTEGVGLKIRGSKELVEIKVRGDKYPCGAEEWTKVHAMVESPVTHSSTPILSWYRNTLSQ